MGNIVRIVATSAEKGNEIIHIISQLTKIYEKNLNSIEFKEEIAKSIPELSSLADVLPQTRTELYAFIAIVITALTIITSHFSNTKNEDSLLTNNDMQEIVDKAVSQLSETPKNTKPNKQINTDREDAAN